LIGVGEDTVVNMRQRAEQCRRLAKSVTDERSADILIQMANQIDADIKRLKGHREERPAS
jgi:hypothetical protein